MGNAAPEPLESDGWPLVGIGTAGGIGAGVLLAVVRLGGCLEGADGVEPGGPRAHAEIVGFLPGFAVGILLMLPNEPTR